MILQRQMHQLFGRLSTVKRIMGTRVLSGKPRMRFFQQNWIKFRFRGAQQLVASYNSTCTYLSVATQQSLDRKLRGNFTCWFTPSWKTPFKFCFYTTVKKQDLHNKIIYLFLMNNISTTHPQEHAFQMAAYTVVAQNPHRSVAPDKTLDRRKQQNRDLIVTAR